ncbi:MAG: DUF3592 domain-containing protein [bacterium]
MATLIGYAMWCCSAWTLFRKWQLSKRVESSLSWPSTEGEVISSSISHESSGTYDRPNKTYRANIRYRYKVGSRELTNNKICVGGQLQISLRGKAEDYCREYPVGEIVEVHYNPKKPRDSVLETREETSFFYLVIGAVLAIVGFGLVSNVF